MPLWGNIPLCLWRHYLVCRYEYSTYTRNTNAYTIAFIFWDCMCSLEALLPKGDPHLLKNTKETSFSSEGDDRISLLTWILRQQQALTPYFTFESSPSLPYANEQHVLTSGVANDWAVWEDWFGSSSPSSICSWFSETQSAESRRSIVGKKRWITVLDEWDNFLVLLLRDPAEKRGAVNDFIILHSSAMKASQDWISLNRFGYQNQSLVLSSTSLFL